MGGPDACRMGSIPALVGGGMSSVTTAMAQWAANLTFDQILPDAIYQAKRYLLDSLGCGLGGFQQPDVSIALAVLD